MFGLEYTHMGNFHPLEAMIRETQLQVGENLNKLI